MGRKILRLEAASGSARGRAKMRFVDVVEKINKLNKVGWCSKDDAQAADWLLPPMMGTGLRQRLYSEEEERKKLTIRVFILRLEARRS